MSSARVSNVIRTLFRLGVASVLLLYGKTVHSTFNVNSNTISADSICNLTARCNRGKSLIDSDILIFDEVGMLDKFILESVNKTSNLLCKKESNNFSGKTVL